MHYEEYGEGSPLVLLHGYGGCTKNWHPFVEALAALYRVLVVDLRGHGASTRSAGPFTHEQSARDVFLLLEKLDIERLSAMGMSTGAMTLLHMATSEPNRLDSMVLVSATSHFPPQARTIMKNASFERMPESVREMYRACATRGEEQVRSLLSDFNALGDRRDDMKFSTEALSAIATRTLIVHGVRDRFFPVDIPRGLYDALKNAVLWIIPGGDHVPTLDPNLPFTETALCFLEGRESAVWESRL